MAEFGSSLPSLTVPPPGPQSRELAQRLAHVESRNVTHLTPHFPVFWTEARGANVRDADGNVYLDLTGAFGVSIAGHAPASVIRAMGEQATHLIHGMGDVHPPVRKVEFLERLAGLTPWEDARAILGSSGSEAVEAALKTALMATGRPGILAFEGAYHGLTAGALAATSRPLFRAPFLSRIYSGARFAPFPGSVLENGLGRVTVEESLEAARWILREGDGGDEVGAVIVEPIQGRAGIRIPPPGFLRKLAELTHAAGAMLIFDEIFTGLGRTGSLFAFEQEDVTPDLLCLGKGLGGGLPLSACIGPRQTMDAWPASDGEAIHTSTFLGNPLACAAGLAVLDELTRGTLLDQSRLMGERLLVGLGEVLAGTRGVREVRGRGLFIGVDLVEPSTGEPFRGGAGRVAVRALQNGILVLPAGAQGEVVELSPPLVITKEQLDWVIPRMGTLVREVLGE